MTNFKRQRKFFFWVGKTAINIQRNKLIKASLKGVKPLKIVLRYHFSSTFSWNVRQSCQNCHPRSFGRFWEDKRSLKLCLMFQTSWDFELKNGTFYRKNIFRVNASAVRTSWGTVWGENFFLHRSFDFSICSMIWAVLIVFWQKE